MSPIQRFVFSKVSRSVYSTKANKEKQESIDISETEAHAREIDNQLEREHPLCQTSPLTNTELLYVFVDNSNILVEGKYVVAELENLGIQCMVFEKKVGVALAHAIDEVIFTKNPGILAIISEDDSYDPIVTTAIKRNWIVETWFWNSGMSDKLRNKTIFTPLDYYYKSFAYGFGPNITMNNRILEVTGHTFRRWGNKEMMDLQLVKRWIENSPYELQVREKGF
ncbi:4639_t:CDS:2 [Funneliformis caledonium]|uniref:4639_t:CDS:1 n=1 Tax=Funneliformis caledonium TaxID=1117310 RepID=A0A9N9F8T8_9GLOM|nr:4639_t:CDS:2 [Funneliformis caledonium]